MPGIEVALKLKNCRQFGTDRLHTDLLRRHPIKGPTPSHPQLAALRHFRLADLEGEFDIDRPTGLDPLRHTTMAFAVQTPPLVVRQLDLVPNPTTSRHTAARRRLRIFHFSPPWHKV